MYYPQTRMRRLRTSRLLREMVRETELDIRSLVYPVFVSEISEGKEAVESMPGMYRFSLEHLLTEIKEIDSLKIPAVLLFGVPAKKDERGTAAYAKNGIVQRAVKAIKEKFPHLIVITDVCLCAYTTAGHCGVVKNRVAGSPEPEEGQGFEPPDEVLVYNDPTCELLAKMAVSHAEAGADIVAPSSMMDGQVAAVRKALDANNYKHVAILAYSAKFASGFYGPFRDAAQSSPEFGNRDTYQLNPANAREAMREITCDVQEGADMIMIKPALAYLDIIYRAKTEHALPIVAYNVSGEYAMIKAAGGKELIDEKNIILEILTGIKRAGADVIITYHAKDVARWLSKEYLL